MQASMTKAFECMDEIHNDELKTLAEQCRRVGRMHAFSLLSGAIAEEFNNLVTAIRVYSDVLLDREAPPENNPAIRGIKRAAEKASTLARHLLEYSRWSPEALARINVHQKLVDLAPFLRGLVGVDVRVSLLLKASNAQIWADEGIVEQMFVTFAINAREAMPEGGVVTIQTGNQTLPDPVPGACPGSSIDYLVLEVCDTGIGMSPAVRARAFEPFFTTKPGRGLGLGLAAVQELVTESGGKIEVVSCEGNGTTLRVFLPVV